MADSLFDAKLRRDDLEGAIAQSLLNAENALMLARQARASLKDKQAQIKALANAALAKHKLL